MQRFINSGNFSQTSLFQMKVGTFNMKLTPEEFLMLQAMFIKNDWF